MSNEEEKDEESTEEPNLDRAKAFKAMVRTAIEMYKLVEDLEEGLELLEPKKETN